jgi:PleD family two-component response regulator
MNANHPDRPTDKNSAPTRRVTILVADDDADTRLYVRRCLESVPRMRKVIVEAVDGEDALLRVRRGDIDLLITDVVMPRLDGFALCRAVQQDARLNHVLILIITGELSAREVQEHVGDEGPIEVIAKPFNADQLSARVAQILGNATQLRKARQRGSDS